MREKISAIFAEISQTDFIPAVDRIFSPLSIDMNHVKVVIVGQDPYPNPDYADGFAFSVKREISPFPASLINIFKELESDLSTPIPLDGNLERWAEQGVLLINRTLTTKPGESHSHQRSGWLNVTESIISSVAAMGAVGILWGGNAHQLADHFTSGKVIKSAHPSPLSAYRGFFGSRPFSKANEILIAEGESPIRW
jgi:uracil-DNA glycosylase